MPGDVREHQDPVAIWDYNFTNHKPTDEGIKKMEHLRLKAKELSVAILASTTPSREQSLALTNLETALFYANAAVARVETEDNR